ncbi:MAG: hypothetical protein LBJ21_02705, partial [Acidobacteriota bacterium]|nr:hypothetical protein [Acidobacteriota bacterium]
GWVSYSFDADENPSDLEELNAWFYSDEKLKDLYVHVTQLPDRTIAGIPCKVYTATDDGNKVTVALWNGLAMLAESESAEGEWLLYEARAVTFDVPGEAFTQTLDVTWID